MSKCAAGGSLKIQDAKNRHIDTTAQLCRAISSQLRHVSTIGKNMLGTNTCSTCCHNNGWELLASLGHPCKFQLVSRLGGVTTRYSSSGRQPKFAASNRGRHLYSAGRPARWALAHISSIEVIMWVFFVRNWKIITVFCLRIPHWHLTSLTRRTDRTVMSRMPCFWCIGLDFDWRTRQSLASLWFRNLKLDRQVLNWPAI